MKIASLGIRNFRTLEAVDLSFPSSYAAICGPNDCGKTNVVRAVRALMKEETPFPVISFAEEEEVTLKEDYPKWKDTPPSERKIEVTIVLEVDRDRDAGFYQFLTKQLSLENPAPYLELAIEIAHGPERPDPVVKVTCASNTYTDLEAQEVLKRLQSSRSILFHNSTQTDPRFPFRSHFGGVIRAESAEHESLVASMKRTVKQGAQQDLEDTPAGDREPFGKTGVEVSRRTLDAGF
jgi:predicted ATP-dependent endonuclease of OLD family